MTEQEIINNEVKNRLEVHDEKFNSVISKVDNLIAEMRDKDNHRSNEMSEIRQSLQAIQANINNVSTAAFIGVGAIVISSISVLVAAVVSILK